MSDKEDCGCTCKDEDIDPHGCPFAQEINDNDDPEYCRCCDECRYQCSQDI